MPDQDNQTSTPMNEFAQDAWYYTREGERLGPVTLTELRVKASQGGLSPRLDMVWTEGMADWKPAGEIDGLFERRVSEPQADTTALSLPEAESVGDLMHRHDDWPGTRRRGYLAATILVPLLWALALDTVPSIYGKPLDPVWMENINNGGALMVFIIALFYSLQRLSNLGMSRWWIFGHCVPLLNLWVGYRCFACPAGYAYHKKLDGIGIALAIIYWLMIALAILTLVVLIYILIKYADDPRVQELWSQLREAIEQAKAAAPAL